MLAEDTPIGSVVAVNGVSINVRLGHLPSSLAILNGETFRLGQTGSLYAIKAGLIHLIGICDGVMAGAPRGEAQTRHDDYSDHTMTLTLFGEVSQGAFQRGVGQYPTIGDELYVVDTALMRIIYKSSSITDLSIGVLSSAPSVQAPINLDTLITRHSAVFGSTGSGKSNFVGLLVEALTSSRFPGARVLILDPHGEYGFAGKRFDIAAADPSEQLYLPYWALPFDSLLDVFQMRSSAPNELYIRDIVIRHKREYASKTSLDVDVAAISADSPVPFSVRELWLELQEGELATYTDNQKTTRTQPTIVGNATTLVAPQYPAHMSASNAPFAPVTKGLQRNLDALKSLLTDPRYAFLAGKGIDPILDPDVPVVKLADLVCSWIGSDQTVCTLDLSNVDSKVDGLVAGSLLSIVYEFLFWGCQTEISALKQPVLIVLDEAHRVLPCEGDTICNRIGARIAKEGRKYGVGLMLVTQRPSEVNETILSQIGTLAAMRTTNAADRAKILAVVPDEFGGLGAILPGLRNGEAFVVGEAVPLPTRMRTPKAIRKLVGGDPPVSVPWSKAERPAADEYLAAYKNWVSRKQ